jgi:hypothetical protein
MKKSNVLALVAGLSAAMLSGCGKENVPAPVNPIQQAQNNGQVPNEDPRTDGDVGPIEGEWVRKNTDTVCVDGSAPRSTITSYSYVIDNLAGSVVITYTSGATAAIPVQYYYPAGNTAGNQTGRVIVSRGIGAVSCLPATDSFCKGYTEPQLNQSINWTKSSDGKMAFEIDKDNMCLGTASKATLTLMP